MTKIMKKKREKKRKEKKKKIMKEVKIFSNYHPNVSCYPK